MNIYVILAKIQVINFASSEITPKKHFFFSLAYTTLEGSEKNSLLLKEALGFSRGRCYREELS